MLFAGSGLNPFHISEIAVAWRFPLKKTLLKDETCLFGTGDGEVRFNQTIFATYLDQ